MFLSFSPIPDGISENEDDEDGANSLNEALERMQLRFLSAPAWMTFARSLDVAARPRLLLWPNSALRWGVAAGLYGCVLSV